MIFKDSPLSTHTYRTAAGDAIESLIQDTPLCIRPGEDSLANSIRDDRTRWEMMKK
jgi:hypothetical protein